MKRGGQEPLLQRASAVISWACDLGAQRSRAASVRAFLNVPCDALTVSRDRTPPVLPFTTVEAVSAPRCVGSTATALTTIDVALTAIASSILKDAVDRQGFPTRVVAIAACREAW